MKSLIAISAIISLVCGCIVGKFTSSSVEETQIASKAETRYDRSKSHDTRIRGNGDNALLDSILDGRPISEIPVADLAALCIKLKRSVYDPNTDSFTSAKQSYQLELLISKLSATDLVNITTELCSDPKTKNSRELLELISCLAYKDPARALDWISTQEDCSEYHQMIIRTIAGKDPLRASSLLNSALADGKITETDHWRTAQNIARSTAKHGSDLFFRFLDSLPKDTQLGYVSGSGSRIPENDRIKFLDEVFQRIQDGRYGDRDLENVISEFITKDKDATKERFNKLPESEQKNECRTKAALSLYLSGDKQAAAEWMKEAIAAAPGKEKDIIYRAMDDLRRDDADSVAFIANLLPEDKKFTAEDIGISLIDGSNEIAMMAGALSDPNEKSIFIANSIKEISQPIEEVFLINSNDLDFLSLQVATMGLTGQNADRVKQAIEAAKKQLTPSNR